jgi:hypothetical protein
MLGIARRLLFVLIAFAVAGGTTTQLARAAAYVAPMTMAGMPCDMTMPAVGGDHGKPAAPCKSVTTDCPKLVACVAVTDIALPARLVRPEFTTLVSAVEFWPALSKQTGLASTPEPTPPRTT